MMMMMMMMMMMAFELVMYPGFPEGSIGLGDVHYKVVVIVVYSTRSGCVGRDAP